MPKNKTKPLHKYDVLYMQIQKIKFMLESNYLLN